ncbi:MAG: CBS domain-containing protein [Candidatus Kapabacteria bacterium]|nr:CBS domain-containing protein [Candidatus Kapabacteria bacterium]MDW8011728.1 CBS domain-containing protein [Bacteroidota bacterium]
MEELLWLVLWGTLLAQIALNLWRGVVEEEPWMLMAERSGEEVRLHRAVLSFWETVVEGAFLFAVFFLLQQWGLPMWGRLVGVAVAILLVGCLRPMAQVVGMLYPEPLFRALRGFFWLLHRTEVPWRFLLRWLPRRQEAELVRQELSAVVETARQEGALEPEEYRLVTNLMRLRNIRVADVMTPRTVMVSCPADISVRDALRIPELRNYSRIPVWEGEPDTIIGYVLTKELLWAFWEGRAEIPVRQLVREVHFLPETLELDHALEAFLEKRQHLFVVVDEYGGVEGILTLEDIVETLLGVEIVDEADKVADLRELAKLLRQERIARSRGVSAGGIQSAEGQGKETMEA